MIRGCAKRVSADEKADGDQMQRSEQNVQVARLRDRAPLLRRKDNELIAATHLRSTFLIPAPGSAHRAISPNSHLVRGPRAAMASFILKPSRLRASLTAGSCNRAANLATGAL